MNIKRLKSQMPERTTLIEIAEKDIQDDAFTKSDIPNTRKNGVIYFLQDMKSAGLGYTDLTDRFLYQPSRDNNYIMVAYHCDGSTILIKAIKIVKHILSLKHGSI